MQDLENDAVRVRLGIEVIAAMDAWQLTREEQRELIRLSRDEWARVQKQAPLPLQFEVLERVEQLLDLSRCYPKEWFRAPGTDGESPVQRMLRDGPAVIEVLLAEAPTPRESET